MDLKPEAKFARVIKNKCGTDENYLLMDVSVTEGYINEGN
jgi:hypothetical protein